MTAAVVVGIMLALTFGAAPARAETIAFWEQSDINAAKAVKRVKARKASAYRQMTRKRTAASRKKLGGYAAKTEPKRYSGKRVRVAALGDRTFLPPKDPAPNLTGDRVRWVASSGCLDGGLRSIVYAIAAAYGPVTVNSTCRSKSRNRAVGGAHRSKHLSGDAVDFRVRGNVRAVYAYLRSSGGVGGLKHYGGGLFHIDNGPRRSW
ncbi:MAG: YcbK family protein [Hyphomicrobium sp.]